MKETTRETRIDSEQHEQTLPGLGPQLGMERLEASCSHGSGAIRLTQDEQAALDVIRAQADRYDWFAERVDRDRPVEELAAILMRAQSGPGLWEEALVALSLSHEETASTLLAQWPLPEHDPEMCLFHQICVSRARHHSVHTA